MRYLLSALMLGCLQLPVIAQASPAKTDAAQANAGRAVEVRPIARSSTDLFQVLGEFIKARQAYEAGDYVQSLTRYRTVLLHDPSHIQARLGLGHSAIELGYKALAADIFSKMTPEGFSADETRALIIGQSLTAQAHSPQYETETKSETKSGKNSKENSSKARRKALKYALELYPDAPRLWAALGDNYVQAKAYKEAAAAYNSARAQGYDGAKYAYKFGLMNIARGKYEIAGAQFKTAARLDPDQGLYDTHYRLAHLLGGDYIRALEDMPPARAGYILGEAGQMAMQRGEYELARLCLKKALEVSPSYNAQAAKSLDLLKTRAP